MIDRTEYLKRCQLVSTMKIEEMPDSLFVFYDNMKYIPYGFNMSFNNGVCIQSAVLRDIMANSVVCVPLGKVTMNV